jgi:hypothetical protein
MVFGAGGEQEQNNYGASSQFHEVLQGLVSQDAMVIALD